MISFKALNQENKAEIVAQLSEISDEHTQIYEIAESLIFDGCDVEYAITLSSGCILIRGFDMGRYFFVFPIEISGEADLSAAISSVAEYAMREEIPLVFVDTPAELLPYLSGFRHMDIDAEDRDGGTYRIKVKTECQLIDEIPEVEHARVKLNSLTKSDISEYARLCKDENVNKCWGYNYLDDVKDPSDEYFFESAMREFSCGTALVTAARAHGAFVGECTLYAFDGRGSAEFAVRLLPECQGKGLGTEMVLAAMALARRIGLVTLTCQVMKENTASVAMLKKVSDSFTEQNGVLSFTVEL